MAKLLWVGIVIGLAFRVWVDGFADYRFNETQLSLLEAREASSVGSKSLQVQLTLVQGAASKGAGTTYLF